MASLSSGGDPKLEALANSMAALVDLHSGIKTDNIDTAPELAVKFNAFATSLKAVHSAGKGIDNSLLLEIPVDMLEYLGEDITNPEMYQHAASKQYENKAKKVTDRLHYLTSIDKTVLADIDSMVPKDGDDAMKVEVKKEGEPL